MKLCLSKKRKKKEFFFNIILIFVYVLYFLCITFLILINKWIEKIIKILKNSKLFEFSSF
jgi:hypothetical protein